MATITTRAGKGSPLTNTEVDANFTNLNTDKLESTDLSVSTGAASGGGSLSYSAGVFTFAPADLSSYITDLSSFTTTNLTEGTNLYYTDERVDDRVNTLIQAGLGITTSYDDINGELTIESDTIEELCKNGTGSTILKGTPVYQTGTAGNFMEIAPADASSAATMPAVGVLAEDLIAGAEGTLLLMGRISGLNTSAFSEGDVIYVASGGGYTNTRPTGQSVLVQNLGRVTKVDVSNGGGVVMGSGRANDVPNLTDGNVFIGNASGTYDKRAIVAADVSDLTATATELNYTDGVTSSIQTQLDSKLPSSSYTASDVLTKIKTVDGSGSGLDADLLDGQEGSYYTGYADTAVANLVASAPSTLDTLNELAAALGDDPNFATTVTNSIATKAPIASPTFTGTVTIPTASVTGNITVTGTVDGRDVAADGTKLDGIESGATADQTAAEILTAVKTVDGSGSGLDADLLDGQEGSYYYPASNPNGYTTNVGDITGVTAGSYITGGGTSGTVTVNVDATSANTASKVVARDASGNFSAGTITAALTGNASTATTLQTARTINGVSFNGSANITVADATKLPLTGGTLSGNVSFGDNDKALFGASSDLQIYHDGTHSRIVDQGTGTLLLETNGSSIQLNKTTTENMAIFNPDGAVQLFYDNAVKFTTLSTGIDITGTVRSDSLSNGSGTTKIYYDSSTYFSGTFSDKVTALGNTGTAKTIDCSTANVFTATLTGNCTLTLSTPNSTANRATSFTLVLTNDATAGRTLVLSGGTFKYPGGTVDRTTDANATDIWFFFSPDGGTTWYVTLPAKNLTT